MQFVDPRDRAQAYLILRHLYDGDVIDWPIADGHPLRAIFEALEQQGYVARWDRTWPRHDRYRLTDRGIQAIEAVYRPAGADAIWSDLRGRQLSPAERRAQLQSQGLDPWLWALLHDPSTQWDAYGTDSRSRYVDWLFEDQSPMRSRHRLVRTKAEAGDASVEIDDVDDIDLGTAEDAEDVAAAAAAAHVVDLDREASHDAAHLERNDYDVS